MDMFNEKEFRGTGEGSFRVCGHRVLNAGNSVLFYGTLQIHTYLVKSKQSATTAFELSN
jgi:hypothetical protein